ncbi:MAG TPA: ubiquitin-like small modifier protein 1 [Jatrophihabitans sp.]|jgi:molybdopterin converting factor small subunit|uniref:ubiquitin-like small modifier protein 1 n=1 Tax=Jatrophihabitans sp. TaxID=1932789 RepID=UPI002F0C5ADA
MRIKLPAALNQGGSPGMVNLDIPAQSTLGSVLQDLERHIPGATSKIVSTDGKLYGYVNLYVNGDDVRHGKGLDTPVSEHDEVLILPAISGG